MIRSVRHAALCALMTLSFGVRAADGDLDTSFNGSGEATAFAGTTAGWNVQVLGQSDGQVVLIGVLSTGPTLSGSVAVTRLHANGSVDTSFGTNGQTVVDAPSGGGFSSAYGALDASGRIVVGATLDFGDHSVMFVMRLTGGGQLDSAFNGSGIRVINRYFVTAPGDTVAAVGVFSVPQAGTYDDAILVAGSMQDSYGKYNARSLAVIPLHDDGSFVDTPTMGNSTFFFGSLSDIADCYRAALPNGAGYDSAVAIARRWYPASGSELIAVAGNASSLGNEPDFGAVIELDDTLQPISSFGFSGVSEFIFAASGTAQVSAIALDDSNRVLVAGIDTSTAHYNLAAGRILTNGFYDTTFNGNGRAIVNFDESGNTFYSYGQAILAQRDGRVVVGGSVSPSAGISQFALVRFTGGGAADPTFTSGTSVVGAHKYTFAGGFDLADTASFSQGEKILLGGLVGTPSVAFGVLRATNDHIFGDGMESQAYLPRIP